MRKYSFVLTLLLLLAPAFPARAQVPPEKLALLVLRILAFDRKVSVRAGDDVRIGVVYKPGHGDSVSAQEQIVRALQDAAKKTAVAGLAVKVYALAVGPTFEAELDKVKPVALYLCPGIDEVLASVIKAARAHQSLTFTGTEAYVTSGTSVGLVRRDTRASILVNLKASRAEGADFEYGLLQMAEVIR